MTIVIMVITHLKKIKSMVDTDTSLNINNEKDHNNLAGHFFENNP